MVIAEVKGKFIQLKDKKVPKCIVLFQNRIVHEGTRPQCQRFIHYMEGASDEMILSRADLVK